MVANLSAGKRGWDHRLSEFSDAAVEAQALKDALLYLVDEDTNSFNKVMDAFRLPKGSDTEKEARTTAIENASKYAAEVPYQVMDKAFEAYDLLLRMAQDGNPASVTDAGVGALCIHTCIQGASMNVRINLGGIKDETFKSDIAQKVADCLAESDRARDGILAIVETKMP